MPYLNGGSEPRKDDATKCLISPPMVLTGFSATNSLIQTGLTVPILVSNSGEQACHKFFEYFIVQIRNSNTRHAYSRAMKQFCNWREQHGAKRLEDINSVAVSAYIEQHPAAPQTVLQHLAAIRQLFSWLVQQRVYDADQRVRQRLAAHGQKAVIPPHANRKQPDDSDKVLYQARHLMENFLLD